MTEECIPSFIVPLHFPTRPHNKHRHLREDLQFENGEIYRQMFLKNLQDSTIAFFLMNDQNLCF